MTEAVANAAKRLKPEQTIQIVESGNIVSLTCLENDRFTIDFDNRRRIPIDCLASDRYMTYSEHFKNLITSAA